MKPTLTDWFSVGESFVRAVARAAHAAERFALAMEEIAKHDKARFAIEHATTNGKEAE